MNARNVTVIHTSGDDLIIRDFDDAVEMMGGAHGYISIPAEHRAAVAKAIAGPSPSDELKSLGVEITERYDIPKGWIIAVGSNELVVFRNGEHTKIPFSVLREAMGIVDVEPI